MKLSHNGSRIPACIGLRASTRFTDCSVTIGCGFAMPDICSIHCAPGQGGDQLPAGPSKDLTFPPASNRHRTHGLGSLHLGRRWWRFTGNALCGRVICQPGSRFPLPSATWHENIWFFTSVRTIRPRAQARPEKICGPARDGKFVISLHEKAIAFSRTNCAFQATNRVSDLSSFWGTPLESASQVTIRTPGSVSSFWIGLEEARPNVAVGRLHDRSGCRHGRFRKQPTRRQI